MFGGWDETAGLAGSIGSLPPALATCGLTTPDRDQLRNPTLVSNVGLSSPFISSSNMVQLQFFWIRIIFNLTIFEQNGLIRRNTKTVQHTDVQRRCFLCNETNVKPRQSESLFNEHSMLASSFLRFC